MRSGTNSPRSLATRAFTRGQADTLLDAAAMLDELADALPEAVQQFGIEQVARHFRLMSGRVRSNASQLRSRSVRGAEQTLDPSADFF